MPGADVGLQAEDPTIAELLKPLGYATGQFGKNHLGDQNEFLPTVHGFDEFFGNLYHLNAEEEPELPNYPPAERLPALPRALRPARRHPLVGDRRGRPDRGGPVRPRRQAAHRGHRAADEEADGDHRRRDARARARTSSTASTPRATPFFVWFNTTHMHFRTHPKPESLGQAGPLAVALPRHDDRPRQAWSARCSTSSTSSGIAEDTIVIYSTDNGPHMNTLARRRDDPVPQREEHELGGRLPGPGDDPLARQDPGGRGLQRDRPAPRLAADASSPPPASRTSSRSSSRATRPATRPSRSTSTATTCCPT